MNTTRPKLILRICIALFGAGLLLMGFIALSPASIEREAERAIRACTGSENSTSCYEEHVASLYPQHSLEEVFKVIRIVRASDPSSEFCHVLAHKLGEKVVAEDPERWIEAIPLNPSDGLCSNGFIHGVIGGRFRAEVLDDETLEKTIPDFIRACAPREGWAPSTLDRAICYHGLGHLYDFITDADLPKALSLCERTVPSMHKRVCIEGVFMQIYQPLEPDDFLMIEQMDVKPTKDTVKEFCASFKKNEYIGACLRESWPYVREALMEGEAASTFCSDQPNIVEEKKCYESTSAIIGRLSLGHPLKAANACNNFPETRRALCFSYIAGTALEEDRSDVAGALALCDLSPENADVCKMHLANMANFVYGDDTRERRNFCEALPESLEKICSEKVPSY